MFTDFTPKFTGTYRGDGNVSLVILLQNPLEPLSIFTYVNEFDLYQGLEFSSDDQVGYRKFTRTK